MTTGTRKLSFAGSSILIGYDSPEARRLVDFLYEDVNSTSEVEPHVTLTIDTVSEPGALSVMLDSEQLYHGDSAGTLANLLVGETIYHLADRSNGGLLFHAAAVSRAGRSMMMPGQTGAGKTTLTAWLIHSGLNYLSDELVFIETGNRNMETFTRPLNVKVGALPVLREQLDFDPTGEGMLECSRATLVPHRLLNPAHCGASTDLAVIVFPVHKAGSDFQLARLSKAQTGMRLMECLVNARNLPDHGFEDVARLAKRVDAYAMCYSRFDQIGDRLETLLEHDAAA